MNGSQDPNPLCFLKKHVSRIIRVILMCTVSAVYEHNLHFYWSKI